MNLAETLEVLSVIAYVIAGICFILSIFFWILFRIPTVISALSGRTARKSIAQMRIANEKSGSKSYRESKINLGRGKLTGNIKNSGTLKKQNVEDGRPNTGLLKENMVQEFSVEKTGILKTDSAEFFKSEETGILEKEEATASLEGRTRGDEKREGGVKLRMKEDIVLIHTNEVIE